MRLLAAYSATETNAFSSIPTLRLSLEVFFYTRAGKKSEVSKLRSAPLLVARRRAAQKNFTRAEDSSFWGVPSESMREQILDQHRRAMPLDGALIGFRDAFVADSCNDAEGDMIERMPDLNALSANHRADSQYSPLSPTE